MYDLSKELTLTDHCLVVTKFMDRMSVSIQKTQKFDVETYDLKNLNKMEVRESYEIKISNKFAALENLNDSAT
jgi:pyrroloquinoline quinone (PQQ) biosynthesis protein C